MKSLFILKLICNLRTQEIVATFWGNARKAGEDDEGVQRRNSGAAEKSVRY